MRPLSLLLAMAAAFLLTTASRLAAQVSYARILDPVLPHAWQRFQFEWDAQAGNHTLLTRATDAAGQSQPDQIAYNSRGYLLNIVLPHAVTVS